MGRRNFAIALALLIPRAIWADLSIRYSFDLQFGPAISPAAAQAARQQTLARFGPAMEFRAKGDKCITSRGPVEYIIDAGRGEITLLNPASKSFATIPAGDYADKVLGSRQISPAAQQALENQKVDVQTTETGDTQTIDGIQAEDELVVLTFEASGSPVRLEMHVWMPTAAELARTPALKEGAECSPIFGVNVGPDSIIQRIFGQVAGDGARFRDLQKALTSISSALSLKTEMALYMPGLDAIAPAQADEPAFDASAPLLTMQMNVSELSLNPLPDAAFQPPEGYQKAQVEDLFNTLPATGAAQAQPEPNPNPAPGSKPDNISNPVAVYRPEPQYTEEATRARIEGTVLISLVVDVDGTARDVKVVRSLNLGLDQRAVEAASQWRFRPGLKDGQPVAVKAQIEVTFRLLDNPADPKQTLPQR